MIALFSDFSNTDPYVGLMKMAIYKHAPNCKVIDICHNLPVFNPNASGRLLQALVRGLPKEAIVLAVVDPGVGTDRHALWLEIDGRHFVGPDNGLFARIVNAAENVNAHIIGYDQSKVSASFHGRDVFAPFAANLEVGKQSNSERIDFEKLKGRSWHTDLAEIIYIDHYGNAMTGIGATSIPNDAVIKVKNTDLFFARTFADRKGEAMFWYENSLGLIELSMYGQSIRKNLNLEVGEPVFVSAL